MAVVIANAIVVALLWAVVAGVRGKCVLELPSNGSRDVYCDAIPYEIDLSHVAGGDWTKLDASRNDLTGIRITSDRNVTLPALDLSRNNIPNACHVLAGDTVTVGSMILSHNRIKRFAMCLDTKNLSLSWNHIKSLNRADMANASSLEALNLGHNFILWIENDTFVAVPDLQWLDLSGNVLARISEKTFPSVTLRYLDVSENYDLDRSTAFQPFENLVALNVAGNAELAPIVLGSGSRIQSLDASRTNLTRVPIAPAPLLGSLILSGNAIGAVNGGDLDGFPLLRLLNISGNRIRTVEDDAFGRLDLLTVLDLSGNSLAAVPGSLPARLETLNLQDNEIEKLSVGDFDGCKRLKTLNVRRNRIRHVQDYAFASLLFLENFDLSENPMKMITREMLTGSVKLKVLRLERLPAPDTPTFPFTDTRYLNRIQLTGSGRLAALLLNDTAVLSSLLQLEHLDLTDCSVSSVPDLLPLYMPKMKTFVANELECPDDSGGRWWLRDWLCDIHAAATLDHDHGHGRRTELRLRNRWPGKFESPAEKVRCTRDGGRTSQQVFDTWYCDKIVTSSPASTSTSSLTSTKMTTTNTITTNTTTKTTTTNIITNITIPEQAAVFARLRAKDDPTTPQVVVKTTHPGMIVFVSAILFLIGLACGTVWIGLGSGGFRRFRWRRKNMADVDYQSIEIKSLESLNHVERW